MSICSVSFGKKIPISKCLIKDIKRNKLEEATIYELDCKDESDIHEIESLGDSWKFKKEILSGMKHKFSNDMLIPHNNYFYVMENSNGKKIGISQIRNEKPYLVLNCLETKGKEQYKYIGQNIISFLCKIAQKNGFKKIYIPVSTFNSKNFYIKKCNFRRAWGQDYTLELSGFKMKRLPKKVEKRIQAEA